MTLADVKSYLRVDGTDDDTTIDGLMAAVQSHVRGAVSDFDTYYGTATTADANFTNVADLLMKMMIADRFENRNPNADGATDYSYMERSLMTQLQNWVTS